MLAIHLQPQPPQSQLVQESPSPTVYRVHSLNHALLLAQIILNKNNTPKADALELEDSLPGIFVIGGSGLLSEAFDHPGLERILETQIRADLTTLLSSSNNNNSKAIFARPMPKDFQEVLSESKANSVYASHDKKQVIGDAVMKVFVRRRPTVERDYLNLLARVMNHGVAEVDRTGVGTISTFGEMFRCDLKDGFPLLTSKKVFWKGVEEELLWFLRGETNVAKLHAAGVHFWDGNLNSTHMKSLKLPHGELGPIYGRQWRSFGPDGPVCVHGCLLPGVDQMKRLIDDIRATPNSRRLIVTAWNPMVVDKVALPSCHCFMQFQVKNAHLSCLVYLRSNDLFLGAPLNIASYALLTNIIAGITGLQPGSLIYTIGDAHVYKNHVDQVKLQLKRPNRPLPTLQIDQKIIQQIYPISTSNTSTNVTTLTTKVGPNFEVLTRKHFALLNYHPLSSISAPMAV